MYVCMYVAQKCGVEGIDIYSKVCVSVCVCVGVVWVWVGVSVGVK